MLDITKGQWTRQAEGGIYVNGKLIATAHNAGHPNEELLEGESWLDMRERTSQDRYTNFTAIPIANATLIADAGNTYQKCGKLPSELLAIIDELKTALELYHVALEKSPPDWIPTTGMNNAEEISRNLLTKLKS